MGPNEDEGMLVFISSE